MEDKIIPEGFEYSVECCRYCIYIDMITNQHITGWCCEHDTSVSVFSKCVNYKDKEAKPKETKK